MNINWITLKVKDLAVSKSFYKNFMGMKEIRSFSPVPGKEICFMGADNEVRIELIFDTEAEIVKPGHSVSIGIEVSDYEEIYEVSKKKGIVIAEPVLMGKDMHCFFIEDPDGLRLQIIKKNG